MGEISEKTRVGLTIGGAALLIALVFGAGRFWGSWTTSNDFRDKAIARHDAEIKELRDAMVAVDGRLQAILAAQAASQESSAATVRNTTFLIEKLGQVQVALAERGITIRGD